MNQPITASIDLAQLDAVTKRLYDALPASPNDAPDDSRELWYIHEDLRQLARRSLTSGAPAGMTPVYLVWHENFWIEVAQTDYEGAEENERRIVYEFKQEGK